MLQWRLKLNEARQALRAGRYEEALGALNDPALREFLPAKRLADDLAQRYADRAAQRIEWGQSCAGFADLAAVDQLGVHGDRADAIRREYADRTERRAQDRLVSGAPDSAAGLLRRTKRRGVDSPTLRLLSEVSRCWSEALEHADCGDAPRATARMKNCQAVLAADSRGAASAELGEAVQQAAATIDERMQRRAQAWETLQSAAAAFDWSVAG